MVWLAMIEVCSLGVLSILNLSVLHTLYDVISSAVSLVCRSEWNGAWSSWTKPQPVGHAAREVGRYWPRSR